jgi:fatty-acyl-CoA synthase
MGSPTITFDSNLVHAADIIRRRADLTPRRVAVVELETGARYTYAELNGRANRAASFLRNQLGVQMGDRVSILAHNSIVYLDLLFGLARLGAIFAPLNWRLTARELSSILADCTPKVIFCGPEFTDVLADIDRPASLEFTVSIEGAVFPASLEYEAGIAAQPSFELSQPDLDGNTPCCLLYTSGTTGSPKGAIVPHRQILWNCINTVISWGLNEQDITPVFTPLFHTGGLFAFMLPLLYAGGRVILARSFDADESLRVIEAESCTVILGVPTLFQLWENSTHFGVADFSRVRFLSAGEPPARCY